MIDMAEIHFYTEDFEALRQLHPEYQENDFKGFLFGALSAVKESWDHLTTVIEIEKLDGKENPAKMEAYTQVHLSLSAQLDRLTKDFALLGIEQAVGPFFKDEE